MQLLRPTALCIIALMLIALTAGCFPSIELDTMNYEQYLKKIWVVNVSGSELIYSSFSFFITKIEGGTLEGEFSTGLNIPECSFPRRSPADPYSNYEDIWNFSRSNLFGTIENGVAECWFSDVHGSSGTARLEFREDGNIDVVFDYDMVYSMSKEQYYAYLQRIYQSTDEGREYLDKLLPLEGCYLFRPLNFSDIGGVYDVVVRSNSHIADLGPWGQVTITTALIGAENMTGESKWYPMMFLTNDQNDILCELYVSNVSPAEIVDVVVEDINGDGLNDIIITFAFIDWSTGASSIESDIRICFHLLENGWFYSEWFS